MDMIEAQRFQDPRFEGRDHLRVQTELPAIADGEARVLFLIGGEHRRDVVFGVGRGKEHAWHGQDMRHALIAQGIKAHMNVRRGVFQKAVLHRHFRIPVPQALGEECEFFFGNFGAAAVPANHDARL